MTVSRARASLVRKVASDPWPPTAVQMVTPATVKFGSSANSIAGVIGTRSGICTEDQVDPCRIPSGVGATTVERLRSPGLLRVKGIGPNRQGRKREATSCVRLSVYRSWNTLSFEPYRGIRFIHAN